VSGGNRPAATATTIVALAVIVVVLAVAAGDRFPSLAAQPAAPRWTGTWAAAPAGVSGVPEQFANVTLRLVVHASVGGDRVRITVSNTFADGPLVVGAAHVARREHDAAIAADTDRVLAFGGRPSFTVPPGALALSDPVDLRVAPMSDLAVSLYLPAATIESTTHVTALQTNYVSKAGDFTASAPFDVARTLNRWPFLTGVEVSSQSPAGAVVAFGDSITDGATSTNDTDRSWPSVLATRILSSTGVPKLSVLNLGISGNRVFADGAGVNALARFDRDVLGQAGVKWLMIMEGINDIGQTTDRKSTRLNSSHSRKSRMPSSA